MSFTKLRVQELRQVADAFGVDLEGAKTKNQIAAVLAEEGVSYEMYKAFEDAERVVPEDDTLSIFQSKPENPDVLGDSILVKMDRANTFYQVGQYTFTIEHPFVNMPIDDAQEIFDNETGFRVATPAEVKQYYS